MFWILVSAVIFNIVPHEATRGTCTRDAVTPVVNMCTDDSVVNINHLYLDTIAAVLPITCACDVTVLTYSPRVTSTTITASFLPGSRLETGAQFVFRIGPFNETIGSLNYKRDIALSLTGSGANRLLYMQPSASVTESACLNITGTHPETMFTLKCTKPAAFTMATASTSTPVPVTSFMTSSATTTAAITATTQTPKLPITDASRFTRSRYITKITSSMRSNVTEGVTQYSSMASENTSINSTTATITNNQTSTRKSISVPVSTAAIAGGCAAFFVIIVIIIVIAVAKRRRKSKFDLRKQQQTTVSRQNDDDSDEEVENPLYNMIETPSSGLRGTYTEPARYADIDTKFIESSSARS